MWVDATGAYGYRYRLGFGNPCPTHTHAAGMAGFVHECYNNYILIFDYLILFELLLVSVPVLIV